MYLVHSGNIPSRVDSILLFNSKKTTIANVIFNTNVYVCRCFLPCMPFIRSMLVYVRVSRQTCGQFFIICHCWNTEFRHICINIKLLAMFDIYCQTIWNLIIIAYLFSLFFACFLTIRRNEQQQQQKKMEKETEYTRTKTNNTHSHRGATVKIESSSTDCVHQLDRIRSR